MLLCMIWNPLPLSLLIPPTSSLSSSFSSSSTSSSSPSLLSLSLLLLLLLLLLLILTYDTWIDLCDQLFCPAVGSASHLAWQKHSCLTLHVNFLTHFFYTLLAFYWPCNLIPLSEALAFPENHKVSRKQSCLVCFHEHFSSIKCDMAMEQFRARMHHKVVRHYFQSCQWLRK